MTFRPSVWPRYRYLLAWAFAGVLAFLGLMLFEQVLVLAGKHAGWLGAAIFVTAGVYQLTSFKDVCLRHCRSPMSLLVHYTSFRGPGIDLRVGFHHGLYCVACCWGLMLILVAVGVMNIPAMALLTVVIFAEKLLRKRPSHCAAHRYFFLRCSSRGGDFSQPLSRSQAVLHSSTVNRNSRETEIHLCQVLDVPDYDPCG
jgi:predicted metal-binding membrane protein